MKAAETLIKLQFLCTNNIYDNEKNVSCLFLAWNFPLFRFWTNLASFSRQSHKRIGIKDIIFCQNFVLSSGTNWMSSCLFFHEWFQHRLHEIFGFSGSIGYFNPSWSISGGPEAVHSHGINWRTLPQYFLFSIKRILSWKYLKDNYRTLELNSCNLSLRRVFRNNFCGLLLHRWWLQRPEHGFTDWCCNQLFVAFTYSLRGSSGRSQCNLT